MLTFSLPIAPTANNAFYNRGFGRQKFGRVKSKAYREWIKKADGWYVLQHLGRQKPIVGRYGVTFTFPDMTKGDLDGRIKLILDWLVKRNLVEGDSPEFLRELNTKFTSESGYLVWIKIWEYPGEQSRREEALAE